MKTKGIYFLFRALQVFGLPVLLLYFLFRGLRNRGYWVTLPQRFGFVPHSFRQTGPGAIWFHAVSVGEVLSCVLLLRRIKANLPHTRLFLSTSTLAGMATANQKLNGLADGVFYAPVDYVFAVRRVLRALKPSVVVVAETEVWPNLFREVKRTGACLTIVNGRISDRAYPRDLRVRSLFAHVLPAVDSILAQAPEMAKRFLSLGAPTESVRINGNFKYDFEAVPPAADSPVLRWLEGVKPGKIWIAASTMPPAQAGDPDEDDEVISAFRELAVAFPDLLLILAPRKPERFDVAAQKLDAAGIPYVRRSRLDGNPAKVLLLDTIGELGGLFSVADVVFMGGTLAHRGGHNILEPAFFGKPVVAGPHLENFQAIADEFQSAGAVIRIQHGAELATAIDLLLASPATAQQIGERALRCAQTQGGATDRAAEEIGRLHASQIPCYRPPMPWYLLANGLSRIWRSGGRKKFDTALRDQRRVDAPVVSVGNLTMGGTGKTPCVLRVTELLKSRGQKPAILTRGYKRASPEKYLTLAPGASATPLQTGDEPQIFIRSGLAPVGIGKDRYRTAMLLRREFDTDVMVLDDAFQHVRIARDVDIVLLDALNPLGGGELFPMGRLREPPSALSRAGIVLITRTDSSDLAPAIERCVRRWNQHAPIFRAQLEPLAWVEHTSGRSFPIPERPFGRAGAFCGLGNPQAFRKTLEMLGVEPAVWMEFEDHHRYRPNELKRIASQASAAGVKALVVTEKDSINLFEGSDHILAPLTVYWLKVGMRIEREEEFLAALAARL